MTAHVVTNRIVYTLVDPWPVGVLTGYEKDGGFCLEHVLSFKPRYLLKLLRGGIAYAWDKGYAHIVFHVPPDLPLYPGLTAIGQRLGFVEYAPDYWLLRRPA